MNNTQSYKIYINEVRVTLLSSSQLIGLPDRKDVLISAYTGKVKHLLNYIDMCEKSPKISELYIHYGDFQELLKDFNSLFTVNEAAGGFVENDQGKFLFIFRRGFWDLPKGKIEKKETKKEAAIREVIEETGINEVEIIKKLCITHHTFRNRLGTRIIKKSHWYHMKTKNQVLVPQSSEDIEKAIWSEIPDFIKHYKPIYGNIRDVIHAFEQEGTAED
ncbi:MAG: NUDIX domain-containing protein [Saprospiraceae bacterium]|nr:NUDIX domain-containing protein [Saprospiraceae bacterium]